MSEYEEFGSMERRSWSQASRAQNYVELFASAPDQAIEPLLDSVNIKTGYKVLDVCCGHGNVSEALSNRGCDVWGLDFSAAMLEIARKQVPAAKFVEGDAENLPFPDNEFDVVVSNLGICHVPDQLRALSEVYRTLRPGGQFAMTVWCGPELSPCFKLFYEAIKACGSPEVSVPSGPDFHQFSRMEIAKLVLSENGFSDIALAVIECSWDLERPELLCEIFEKATVRGAMLLANQPPEQLAAIRANMKMAVRERFGAGNRWRVPMPAALISTKK